MRNPETGNVAVVVLCAGRGKRMKSDLPKVMHKVAGRTMLSHVLDTADRLGPEQLVVVIGSEMDDVARAASPATTVVQNPPDGTAGAVRVARECLAQFCATGTDRDVVILFGDAPLLETDTIHRMIARRRESRAAVCVLGAHVRKPNRYGRLVCSQDGSLTRIVEFRDATDRERNITLCNSGIMTVDARELFELLDCVTNDNESGEYYLTDIVEIARSRGRASVVLETDDDEDTVGADDRFDLAHFERVFQDRLRKNAMRDGSTMVAPESVFLSWDTRIGHDVVIEPHVIIGPGVSIGDNVRIRGFCHLEGATLGDGCEVGPFARLRSGTTVGRNVRVGNYVEVKNTTLCDGVKTGHHAYLGDATVGAGTNIGAGTVICNYDGVVKHRTHIGCNAFIGSNTSLVAPLTIGDGAYIAAGSTITKDVEKDALAVARNWQVNKSGMATVLRERAHRQRK